MNYANFLPALFIVGAVTHLFSKNKIMSNLGFIIAILSFLGIVYIKLTMKG